MKFLTGLFICFLLMSCTSTSLVDFWKNPDIDSYNVNKVLIVGISPNIASRQKFEQKMKQELEQRGVEAIASYELLDPSFGQEAKTEAQLTNLEDQLLEDGFDTIFLTKIIGVENKVAYKSKNDFYNESYRNFNEDFFNNQEIYHKPEYYDIYTVYHAETSMYCICPTKERELIWKGYIDIIDPHSTDETVKDYINLITAVLEEQLLIKPLSQVEKINTDEIN